MVFGLRYANDLLLYYTPPVSAATLVGVLHVLTRPSNHSQALPGVTHALGGSACDATATAEVHASSVVELHV